jgi:hypothetical protein
MNQLRIKTNENGGDPAEETNSKLRFDPNAIDWDAVEVELARMKRAMPGPDSTQIEITVFATPGIRENTGYFLQGCGSKWGRTK